MEFKFGATLGHQLFNLKVYSLSGRPPSFSQCLKRRIADLADFSFYGIVGIIIITQSSKHQRAGDHWAKTYVVDIKDPMQMEHINNSQGEWVF
ncbi:MAG: hypothetical protein CL868_06085 [Cytophagaceae bacterium]|nr:hypothetical protein [Cytophagaceae bacterium]|tara:strand:+ start:2962 stop:3240 length:279 start_codon:yes stop_codon:yes gene_type:complete